MMSLISQSLLVSMFVTVTVAVAVTVTVTGFITRVTNLLQHFGSCLLAERSPFWMLQR